MGAVDEAYRQEVAQATSRVADEIRTHPGYVPGTAERLAPLWQVSIGRLPPEQLAERVADMLHTNPQAKALRDPEYAGPRMPNGAEPSPLRHALLRHEDRLNLGSVDQLTARLGAEAAGMGPGQVAALVVRYLASREARVHLVAPPPLPERETRISRLALRHFPKEMNAKAAERLAEERAKDWHQMGDRDVVATIASILKSPMVASRYGASPVGDDDPRSKPNRDLNNDRPTYAIPASGPAPAAYRPGPTLARPEGRPAGTPPRRQRSGF